MTMKNGWAILVLLCIFLSSFFSHSSTFESDELLIEDDEFEGVNPIKQATDDSYSPPPPIRSSVPTTTTRRRSEHDSGDSKVQFTLEHAFGSDADFSAAGIFTARIKTSSHGGQTLTKLRLSRNALTEQEKEVFQELLKKDDFYRIRVPANVLNAEVPYVLSSVKARCLPRVDLEEHIVIHLEGTNILAINYGSAGSCPYPRTMKLPSKWSFNSHTVLKNSDLAPRTPLFTEDLFGGEGLGEIVKPPEKSFWQKYWMYLIPLGLVVMNGITQAMNVPEEQAGGQQAAAAGGQRVANAAGARRR